MICPFCKEEIAEGAIKCKHCKSMLTEPIPQSSSAPVTAVPQQPKKQVISTIGEAVQTTSSIVGGIASLATALSGEDEDYDEDEDGGEE